MTESNMDCPKETIARFIKKQVDQQELDEHLKIFEERLINSLFAIELMTFLEKEFSIKIRMDDLDMRNFESIFAINEFVKKKRESE